MNILLMGLFKCWKINFVETVNKARVLGWNFTVSWISAYFQVEGISSVDINQPEGNVIIPDDSYVVISFLNVEIGNRVR